MPEAEDRDPPWPSIATPPPVETATAGVAATIPET
jgi:hypothetical protein